MEICRRGSPGAAVFVFECPWPLRQVLEKVGSEMHARVCVTLRVTLLQLLTPWNPKSKACVVCLDTHVLCLESSCFALGTCEKAVLKGHS